MYVTDARTGLTGAQVEAARSRWGPNRLREPPAEPAWRRLARQFRELVIWILIVAAGISLLLGDVLDAAAIMAIVLFNGLLGFVQEERAARALQSLRGLTAPVAHVIRDGARRDVPAADLVPGDLIHLEAGDHVPADARLVSSAFLRAQESSLTGESTPVDKEVDGRLEPGTPLADRRNMVHMGTVVAAGRGSAVVTATGMATELGRVAELLERTEYHPTPLQRRLEELGHVLLFACLALVAVIAGLQLLRGGAFLEVFVLAVSLAVAAVPEGLPAVVTVVLALGLQRMARRNALVRTLPSVETLGSVTVICTDKTGTLTRNEMTVREIVAGGARFRVSGAGFVPRGEFSRVPERAPDSTPERDATRVAPRAEPDLLLALAVGARCNNARLEGPADGEEVWKVIGDPTEGALLVAAMKAGVEGLEGREVIYEIPFDPEHRSMTVVVREPAAGLTMYMKGAAEAVAPACDSERRDGRIMPLTPERREEILRETHELSARALRVLALAYREGVGERRTYRASGLVFAGLAGMLDPPRDEAREAVRTCREGGIRPIMITGDHPATALAIARELGMAGPDDEPVTARDLDALSDDALAARVERTPVFARVSAEHKLRIVRAWKARHHVVAMTGDGVNDAPAIRAADVGIAMGVTGTDVARKAADMVLLDDNFASIVAAVEAGRGIFANIQKFVHYLLATNAGEVLFMFLAALAGWPVPLLAIQILWINLVTDGLPAMALGVEPAERDIMRQPPRPPGTPVISAAEGGFVLLRGLLVAAAAATAFALLHGGDDANIAHARSVAFCVIAYAQLLYAFAFRSRRYTLPELGPFSNRHLLAAVGAAGALQFAAVSLPWLQPFFGVTRPLGREWLVIGALALAPVTLVEAAKILRQGLRRSARASRIQG
jgi:Ca2+-transporting ATPase